MAWPPMCWRSLFESSYVCIAVLPPFQYLNDLLLQKFDQIRSKVPFILLIRYCWVQSRTRNGTPLLIITRSNHRSPMGSIYTWPVMRSLMYTLVLTWPSRCTTVELWFEVTPIWSRVFKRSTFLSMFINICNKTFKAYQILYTILSIIIAWRKLL